MKRRRFLQACAMAVGTLRNGNLRAAQGSDLLNGRLKRLDAYVEESMLRWETPGLALALVGQGKLIHARGYGVRAAGSNARVDPATVFTIASCTKAFTAAAIAKLIDQAKLGWDDPIARRLPSVPSAEAEWLSKITIRQA
jgi:CubicO group peptidase (beta-lactamase class C family)